MADIWEKIKKVADTLPHLNRQDTVTFSVFLLIAFFFWVAITAYQQNDVTYTVELHIEGQPANAVFTTHVPSQFKVTLYDSNIRLLNYNYDSNLKVLTVDFARYADVAGNFRISGAELQSLLLNNLRSSTQITAISPSLIDARYAMTDGRMVPVRIKGVQTAAANYRAYQPQLKPDSVLVHAPSYILDTLSCLQTEAIDRYGMTDTLHATLGFDLAVGVKATPDSVHLTIPVVQYVEKRLENLPIQVIGLPAGCSLSLFPRTCNVRMLANFQHYNDIAANHLHLQVAYDSIRSNPKRQFLPIIVSSDIDTTYYTHLQLSPAQVEYTIEHTVTE